MTTLTVLAVLTALAKLAAFPGQSVLRTMTRKTANSAVFPRARVRQKQAEADDRMARTAKEGKAVG